MRWEICDEHGPGWDGVDEFEREELPGADEASVVLVGKVEGEDGEEVGEHEVDGEIGVGVADKVEPVQMTACAISVRERFCKSGAEEDGPVVSVFWPVIFVLELFVVLQSASWSDGMDRIGV